MKQRWLAVVILALTHLGAEWGRSEAKPEAKNPESKADEGAGEKGGRDFAPKGPLWEDFGYVGFVFYFLPKPLADPDETFSKLAEDFFPDTTAEKLDPDDRWDPERSMVGYFTEKAPLKNFPTPDAGQMRHFSRGVSEEDGETVPSTDRAFVVRFAYQKGAVWKSLRAANELAADFAEKTGALIWDSATRELFSAKFFRERRIGSWPEEGDITDIRPQITIHAYKKDEGDYCRAVTLGMRKFALPDFALQDFAWSDNRGAGNLINLVCQRLAETGELRDPENEEVAIAAIKHAGFRESMEAILLGKATGSAQVEIYLGEWEDGDAANRLLEIGFGRYPGENVQLRQARLFDALFGAEDGIVNVNHDKEIRAASERARAKLPALRESLEEGLPPGDHLLLKAPFPRDDEKGNEWMWVEVIKWEGPHKIRGILRNEPFHIKDLHPGMEVDFAEKDVFDYILRKSDGSWEGNETGELIRKKNEATQVPN